MKCRGCHNEAAVTVRTVIVDGKVYDSCEKCGASGFSSSVDCYFNGEGFHHGIYDNEAKPVYIRSKGHKAQVMKELGIRESGDRVHGATSYDPTYSKIAKRNFREKLRKGDKS